MQVMRDSFVLYTKINEVLQALTLEQRGLLFTAIMDYECSGDMPRIDDAFVKLAFIPIKHDLDATNASYDNKRAKLRENGKLGGRPKKAKGLSENQMVFSKTKQKHNDNDNDNVNVNDNIKDIYNHRFSNEFDDLWSRYPRKQGKSNALKSYIKARKSGVTFEEVSQGLDNYNHYLMLEKTEQRFIKQGSTWFNQQCWNDDYASKRSWTTADVAPMMDFSEFMV